MPYGDLTEQTAGRSLISVIISCLTGGICLAVLSALFFSSQDLFVQLCELSGVDVPSMMFYQGMIGAVFAQYRLVANKESDLLFGPAGYRALLWTRALAITLGTICYYQGIAYLPLSVGILIVQVKPLALTGLAYVFLGESLNTSQIIAFVLMGCGQFLIAQPPPFFPTRTSKQESSAIAPRALYPAGDHLVTGESWAARMLGGVLMIGNMSGSAIGMILTRQLSVAVSNEMMLWGNMTTQVMSFLICFAITLEPLHIPETWTSVVFVVAVAFFQIAARLFVSSALRREGVLTVSIAQESAVLFSIAEEWAVFGTHLNRVGLAGGVIIMVSATWALLVRPETVPVKRVEQDTEEALPLVARTSSVDQQPEA